MKKVRVFADDVLIKLDERIEEVGGIAIPDAHQRPPVTGYVYLTGPGREYEKNKLVPLGVKKGDHVLVPFLGGVNMKINGEEYRKVREEDILAVYPDEWKEVPDIG